MISYQTQALWELCRQGYPGSADEAETRWDAGELFHADERVRLPRMLRVMIEQCNEEIASTSRDESR